MAHEKVHPITRLRDEHGILQKDLAERLGVDRSAVSNMESGKRRCTLAEGLMLIEVFDMQGDPVGALTLLHELAGLPVPESAPPEPGTRIFAAVGLEPEQVEEIADDLEQTPPDARRLRLLSWLLPSARAAA